MYNTKNTPFLKTNEKQFTHRQTLQKVPSAKEILFKCYLLESFAPFFSLNIYYLLKYFTLPLRSVEVRKMLLHKVALIVIKIINR